MDDPMLPVATRLDRDCYYMGIAIAVRDRANCQGRRVGAVLVREDRVIATGYNGTPTNMLNCDEGGCHRCANPEQFASGTGYDLCICVHAEQNALLTAARFGIAVDGSVLYTTVRPCFGCTKELLQAGISKVYFLSDWEHPNAELQHEYERIQARIPHGIRRLEMDDPRATWALGRGATPSGTGHSVPGSEENQPSMSTEGQTTQESAVAGESPASLG
ncbi:MAG: dCMP deaminase family protein [Fimbriimonadaceae bacterium]|nr:dCMP deaminase family protein [Fimbriimonadaceae bacterium]